MCVRVCVCAHVFVCGVCMHVHINCSNTWLQVPHRVNTVCVVCVTVIR